MQVNTQKISLKDWAKQSSREDLIWANGYLTGLLDNPAFSDHSILEKFQHNAKKINVKPTIIFGTETGNAKKVASQLQVVLKKNKISSKVIDAFQYPLEKLKDEEFLILIMSTQGEGELPINAQKFYDNLSNLTGDYSKLKYTVFALGDSSYPLFCEAGKLVDEQLERLKANRILPIQKSDVDFMPIAEKWSTEVLSYLQTNSSEIVQPNVESEKSIQVKKNYLGKIRHKVVLNDTGSNKETYHIELVSEEEIHYEPGDAVGFYPKNSVEELNELAQILNWVEIPENLETKNLKGLSKRSLQKIGELLEIEIHEEKADLIDILNFYPHFKNAEQEKLLEILHPISPRLYSISSSPEAHDGELHITVTKDKFQAESGQKLGFCSNFLSELEKEEEIEFYIHKNNHFKLPDQDKDIILIGPGTGIAPFRSFLSHRDETAATGKNWLFFGEQHFVSDFYYQTEIQEWLLTGTLTQLDTAFSRDQKHKIYVQDRIREKAKDFVNWLDNGAYIFICGQRDPMSLDVEKTILEILQSEKNSSEEEAKAYLENLESENRFVKDVY